MMKTDLFRESHLKMIHLLRILACAAALTVPMQDAFAQGATGGSIGNDNKSLSGAPRALGTPRSPAS